MSPHLYNAPQSSIMHIVQTTVEHIINIKNKETLTNAIIEEKNHNNKIISHNLQKNKAKKKCKQIVHKPFPNHHQLSKVCRFWTFNGWCDGVSIH